MMEASGYPTPKRRVFGRSPFRPGEMPPVFGDTAAALIVDDDAVVADVLSQILTIEGYDCTLAADAAEARTYLGQREFALALVDVMMPGETGLELVVHMLDRYRHLAIVMVTGIDDPRIADLALQSGAYGYLVKPFDVHQVVITVASASQRRCSEIERDLYEHRLELHVDAQGADLDEALTRLKSLLRSDSV